jgi:hypothetical protein
MATVPTEEQLALAHTLEASVLPKMSTLQFLPPGATLEGTHDRLAGVIGPLRRMRVDPETGKRRYVKKWVCACASKEGDEWTQSHPEYWSRPGSDLSLLAEGDEAKQQATGDAFTWHDSREDAILQAVQFGCTELVGQR